MIALGIAKYVRARVERSYVWIPRDGPVRRKAHEWGLECHVYDSSGLISRRKLTAALANWTFGQKLRRLGRGIVHFHTPADYGAMRLGLRIAGLLRVVHVHIDQNPIGFRWAFKHPPELILTCARYMVQKVRQTLPEIYQAQQRIIAVPNAVDTQVVCPTEKNKAKLRIGVPCDAPMLLMLANLAPHKGQITTIKAVAELKRRGTKTVCWLAGVERRGGSEYTGKLRRLIEEIGVSDRVQLLGYREDAPQLLQAADFLLLPSAAEGLPLSILEAQATKVPVLAAPTAGIPEIVADGETGFLIHADDHIGYANCIQSLLNDQRLYHTVAEKAYYAVTRENTWRAYCERVWELYSELLMQRCRANPIKR